jgi:hypothetical protein
MAIYKRKEHACQRGTCCALNEVESADWEFAKCKYCGLEHGKDIRIFDGSRMQLRDEGFC